MNMRNTLILFLVFVSLAVFAWTLRDREGKQFGNTAPEPTPGPMWDFKTDDVNEVVVTRGADEYTLSRDGDAWLVDGEATSDEVAGLIGRIAEPTILRVLPEDRDPDVYGFDTPALTITLRAADAETVIYRGDQVPTSSDYYVRLAAGGPIRILSGIDIDRLEEWLDEPPLAPTPTVESEEADEDTDGDADEGVEEGTDEAVDEGADEGGEDEDADATATAEAGVEDADATATAEAGTEGTATSASTAAATSTVSPTARSTPTTTAEPTSEDGEETRP